MNTRTKFQLTALVLLLAIGINLLLRAAPMTGETPVPPKSEKSLLYPETQQAKNPTHLQLLLDHRKVLGWISGNKSFANREVIVKRGKHTSRVKVNAENSFTWPYEVTEPETIHFSIDKLQASVRVTPRPKLEPAVFFVVDRTVYRTGKGDATRICEP